MDYQLESLIEMLRKRLQDEDYDEDSLITFLNQSQSEILGEDSYPFMERIDEYRDIQAGEIDLPLGYGGTFNIFINKKGQPREQLRYIAPSEFFNHTATHNLVWTKYANKIFYRVHGKVNSCDKERYDITHLYLANPMPMKNSTDKASVPYEFIEALILGALARAERQRDNFDYAQVYENRQDALLTNLKMRYGVGSLSFDSRAKLPFYGGRNDARY